jgi:uncharacterized lipoprotein
MIVAITVGGILSGCALVEDKTPIDYVPAGQSVAEIPGAENVRLMFTASDRRTQYGDRVSTKKNGYGMEMARIVSTNDVVELTRTALQQEFKALGFAIGEGGLVVGVELQQFYAHFKSGFFSGTAVAEVGFALRVKDAAGALLYMQFYSAVGTVDDVMLASGTNAKAALEKALGNAVKEAINDKALIQALLSTTSKSVNAPRRGASRSDRALWPSPGRATAAFGERFDLVEV